MTGTLLATTPKASVHALAYQGIMVYTCFPQIRDMIRRRFGDDYVLLFAEPIENRQTSEIDWYTPVYGSPRKLIDLPAEQQSTVADKIGGMARDIQDFAEELIRSPDQMKVTRGHILRLALQYPDESYIYISGDQPVFVCWGFGPGTPGAEPKNLTRLAFMRPPESAPQPEPAPVKEQAAVEPKKEEEAKKAPVAPVVASAPFVWSFGCLWWLLPLLLALLLFWLLFASFNGLPAIAGKTLFLGPDLAFLDEPQSRKSEILNLRSEIDHLRSQLDNHVALCMPEKSMAVKEPEEAPVQEGEGLVIPEKGDDTRFLQGEWLCKTGLANVSTREPVVVMFAYDGQGRGKATVIDRDDRCTGDASAELKDGVLLMSVGEQRCSNSDRSYNPVNIKCENTDGEAASCRGINHDGTVWEATFVKVKK